MEKQLPKNWVETELGEITTKPQYGWTSKAGNEGEIKYLRTTDLSKGKVNWETVPYCIEIPDDISKYQVEKNDILISRAGSVGFSHRIENAPERAVFASYLIRFKPLLVNPKLIEFYLNSAEYWNSISDVSAGIAVQNINAPKLSGLKFPLPPLDEQNRIVTKLDALFAQLETIKTSMAKVPLLLKDFRQQVLTQAVTGKLTEEWRKGKELDEWKELELGKICSLKAGKFVSASEINNEKQEGYFPCYGGNGLRGYVKSFTHIGRYSLIGRQGALCGNVHLIEGQFHATEHALVVTPLIDINEIWLFFKLTSLELINYSKGVAQPGLSVMNLNPIQINIPPIKEQQEIVSRVESLFAKADAIEKQYETLKAKIESLPQAILHKAFKGELTEQLDSDGDARELLREIEGLKAVMGKKVKNNTTKSVAKKV